MARKTVVELVDDLDGGLANETVRFALDGVDYSIDLSAENATRLREKLAAFVERARRAANRSRRAAEPAEDPAVTAAVRKADRKRANREALKSIRAAAERTAAAVKAATEPGEVGTSADVPADVTVDLPMVVPVGPAGGPGETRATPVTDDTNRRESRSPGSSGSGQGAALIVPFQAAGNG